MSGARHRTPAPTALTAFGLEERRRAEVTERAARAAQIRARTVSAQALPAGLA